MSSPGEELSFVDTHCRRVAASADVAWDALVGMLRGQARVAGPWARVLACDPLEATAGFAGLPGEAIPGFRVAEAELGRRLVLEGRHRFAHYSLTFELRGDELCAVTHAAFPGLRGRLYRAAVIGSGAHGVVTRGMLRKVARRCEAPPPGGSG